jgi:hypothetical protein
MLCARCTSVKEITLTITTWPKFLEDRVVFWKHGVARRVLPIPATSASPDCLFSTTGNEMTKNHTGLTCCNLETIVYLHEVWPKVREWEACNWFKADYVAYH